MAIDQQLEQVLSPEYLTDLSARNVEELKAMRQECQLVESKLSYLRRLVQGRLDIVSAEMDRRAAGPGASNLDDLVDKLPEILADKVRAPGPGRMPTNLAPPDDDDLTAELDAVSGPAALGVLPDLSDAELGEVSSRLKELEQRVSGQRRAIFTVIDAIQGELASRYEREVGA
jgi:hypothetical protein